MKTDKNDNVYVLVDKLISSVQWTPAWGFVFGFVLLTHDLLREALHHHFYLKLALILAALLLVILGAAGVAPQSKKTNPQLLNTV